MPTELCKNLGMVHPVFQAAIGGIACPALAAAVSNAGGMGTITLTGWGADGARARLEETFARTDKGFAANLLLNYDIRGEFREVLKRPPKIISLFLGDVSQYMRSIHEVGSLAMVSVGSLDEAKRAADAGADIIVAQGWEAGGHVRGQTATIALVPEIADALPEFPILAGGGISDGRTLAAALCLGAGAAWVGTRFLAADEADIHPDYLRAVLTATARDTIYSTLFESGTEITPGRVIENETTRMWQSAGRPSPGARPGEGDVIVTDGAGVQIKRYQAYAMRSDMRGKVTSASLWAGQGVGAVICRQPAAEIVEELSIGANSTLEQQVSWLSGDACQERDQ